MSLLALLLLATAPARIEAVNLTTFDSHLAVRVALSGQPGMVAVHREGEGARVSISDVALGGAFAGGTRFAWSPANGFDPALLSAPARLDRIEVAATPGEVSVLLRVPPEISIDVRHSCAHSFPPHAQAPLPKSEILNTIGRPVAWRCLRYRP